MPERFLLSFPVRRQAKVVSATRRYPDTGERVPVAISLSSRATCPPSCPLRSDRGEGGRTLRGCYAESQPGASHWDRVDRGGGRSGDWEGFIAAVRRLPAGTLFRHNQAGDLPFRLAGGTSRIDAGRLRQLAGAASHVRGWTYTHHPTTPENLAAIGAANRAGFCVNASADSPLAAVRLVREHPGLPVVCTVPADYPASSVADGVRVVVCPAQTRPGTDCVTCSGRSRRGLPLCARPGRGVVVAFRAHGQAFRRAEDAVFRSDAALRAGR